MKSTLKQQISAVNFSRKHFSQVEYDYDKLVKTLNDAASTLAALNLIGTQTVLIAPELIRVVKDIVKDWNSEQGWDVSPHHIHKLEVILKRLPE